MAETRSVTATKEMENKIQSSLQDAIKTLET